MKLKLNAFTIFLILLIILVVSVLFGKWYMNRRQTESFVNFHNDNVSGNKIYIPQYSTKRNRKVISLYDNLYFDQINGCLIEVDATSCNTDNISIDCNDKIGSSISNLYLIPRPGSSITTYPSPSINTDGSVSSNDTMESLFTTVEPGYHEFSYRTKCINTEKYQIFYIAWGTDTYIHLVDLNQKSITATAGNGNNMKTFYLNSSNGLVDTFEYSDSLSKLPNYINSSTYNFSTKNERNNTSFSDPNYLNGSALIFQITPQVFFDINNGIVLLKDSSGNYICYNRSNHGTATTAAISTIDNITKLVSFTITDDIGGGMVLVIAYGYNTIVTYIVPRLNDSSYIIDKCLRFNDTQSVVNATNDKNNDENAGVGNSGAGNTGAGNTGAGNSGAGNTGAGNTGAGNNVQPNSIYNLNNEVSGKGSNFNDAYSTNNINGSTGMSSVCGDDLSCKWYWYFQNLSQNSSSVDYFTDDYFLKSEAVPNVCPNCPSCASDGSSSGTCTNCGGNGGSGTLLSSCTSATTIPGGCNPTPSATPKSCSCGATSTTAPCSCGYGNTSSDTSSSTAASTITTTPAPTATITTPSGMVSHLVYDAAFNVYKDAYGNQYTKAVDASGNSRYILKNNVDVGDSLPTTTPVPTSSSIAATSTSVSNPTSTSVPNITENNSLGGVTNNIINTAGGLTKDVLGTAKDLTKDVFGTAKDLTKDVLNEANLIGTGAGNFFKDTGSGAVGLLKDTGSGAVGLLKDTGSGAVGLLKDTGSGIMQLGKGPLQANGQSVGNGFQSVGQGNIGVAGGVGAGGVGVGGVGVGGVGVGGVGVGVQPMNSISDSTFGYINGQTPVDNYSYYGALQSKGGNFMPVTADFSSFRK